MILLALRIALTLEIPASSQAYATRFQNKKPEDVPGK